MMKIRVPAKPEYITIKQYRDYHMAMTGAEKVVAITGCPIEVARKLSFTAVDHICELFETMCDTMEGYLPPMVRLYKDQNRTVIQRLLKGRDYMDFGFIPDIESITTAEFCDLMQLSETTQSALENMVRMAMIYFRPVTMRIDDNCLIEEYDSNRVALYRPYIENLPLRYYIGARAFFLALRNELLLTIPQFSEAIKTKAERELGVARKRHAMMSILRKSTAH